jgi:aquaporin Z
VPFAGVAMRVHEFGKILMAQFIPAVTVGFLVSDHIKKAQQLPVYLCAEIVRAMFASMFVMFFIGIEPNLGANMPKNHSFPLRNVFGIEVLATAFLIAVIFAAVYTRGLKGWSGLRLAAW